MNSLYCDVKEFRLIDVTQDICHGMNSEAEKYPPSKRRKRRSGLFSDGYHYQKSHPVIVSRKEFRMKIFRSKNKTGYTMVEIVIVVLIVGFLLAIATPDFVTTRESSRAKACVGNLKQIDNVPQQDYMDNKLCSSTYATAAITVSSLIGTNLYIRATPVCPPSGTYTIPPAITDSPYSSVSGNASYTVTLTSTGTDYTSGGRFYRGL